MHRNFPLGPSEGFSKPTCQFSFFLFFFIKSAGITTGTHQWKQTRPQRHSKITRVRPTSRGGRGRKESRVGGVMEVRGVRSPRVKECSGEGGRDGGGEE